MQERVGMPLTCTVHAPHCAMPQPNLVPVSPSSSRTTHKSGVSPGCSEWASLPLTTNLIIGFLLPEKLHRTPKKTLQEWERHHSQRHQPQPTVDRTLEESPYP